MLWGIFLEKIQPSPVLISATKFLHTGYSDRMAFINRMNSIIGYAVSGLQFENVSIYTENPTLPGSGSILPGILVNTF